MKLFEREKPGRFENITLNEKGTMGTVFWQYNNTEWSDFVEDITGFESEADAYVYVLGLVREQDESRWYYVGKSDDGEKGVRKRIQSHVNNFDSSRTIIEEGVEILVPYFNIKSSHKHSHRVIGVERFESIFFGDLNTSEEWIPERHVSEIERRTAYEIAIEKDTTNVLGGK